MNAFAKLAIAAAAVVAVAVIGINLMPDQVGPGATPSVSPSPTPTPINLSSVSGPLDAGTYSAVPTGAALADAATFTLPDGWSRAVGPWISKGKVSISFWTVLTTYGDPCNWMSTTLDLGPTVDDLVSALGQQKDRNATAPVPTTLGGFDGQLIEVDWPADVDESTCDQGEYRLLIAPGPNDPSRWGTIGAHSVLRIADVNGTRVLVELTVDPGGAEADVVEAQQIIDSVRFD